MLMKYMRYIDEREDMNKLKMCRKSMLLCKDGSFRNMGKTEAPPRKNRGGALFA